MWGMLSDGYFAQFFEVTLGTERGVLCSQTDLLVLQEKLGLLTLAGFLLHQPPVVDVPHFDFWRFHIPNADGGESDLFVNPVGLLGRSLAWVCEVEVEGKHYAMKVDPCRADIESAILRKLNQNHVPGVPQLIALRPNVLLLEPVGHQAIRQKWKSSHVCQLIETLKRAHMAQVVHRDVRLENFVFSSDEKSLILIDWACAVDLSVTPGSVPYEGTFYTSASGLFPSMEHVPCAENDLESVVKMMIFLFVKGQFRYARKHFGRTECGKRDLDQWFHGTFRERDTMWKPAFAAASQRDYESLSRNLAYCLYSLGVP